MRSFLLLSGLFCSLLSFAQTDTLPVFPETPPLLEDVLQDAEEEVDFDFDTYYEPLEALREHPLDLNRADREQLQEIRLLNDLQIEAFLEYRATAGPLLALYELQVIPGFDLPTIRRLLPYVSLRSSLDDFHVPLPRMLSAGKNELYLRWSRTLESSRGFLLAGDTSVSGRFLGDPNKWYTRFKHSYENRLSYGFTAEKDAGEEFFRGSNPQGFDFYSAHLFARHLSRTVKAVALGDFTASFGQGLILYSGFGYGKSAATMEVKRSGRVLRPFTSVNEASFYRGAAATLAFGPLEATVLGSYRRRDGNVVVSTDTTETQDLPAITLSSILNSGLHRTPAEIADEGAFHQLTFGGCLRYSSDRFAFGLNAVLDRLDQPISRTPQPYNRFYFNGNQLWNGSLDYTYRLKNLLFFGETAVDPNGRLATLNGLLAGLDRKVDVSLLQRWYSHEFQSLNGFPFAETNGVNNEAGVYLGAEIRPASRWRLNVYYDLYRHPWLRFRTDAPSRGRDWLVRLTYYQKRKLEVYLQVRRESKEQNATDYFGPLDRLVAHQTLQARLQLNYHLSKALEWRNRIAFGTFREGEDGPTQRGWMIYQDLLVRPLGAPWSFTTRFALFDTDSFDVPFYSFENDLLYQVSIPAYFGRGARFYFNLRYRPIRPLTLEFRFAQTYYPGLDEISDGVDAITGKKRTDLRAQMRWQF